jgi:hypothetical protein
MCSVKQLSWIIKVLLKSCFQYPLFQRFKVIYRRRNWILKKTLSIQEYCVYMYSMLTQYNNSWENLRVHPWALKLYNPSAVVYIIDSVWYKLNAQWYVLNWWSNTSKTNVIICFYSTSKSALIIRRHLYLALQQQPYPTTCFCSFVGASWCRTCQDRDTLYSPNIRFWGIASPV